MRQSDSGLIDLVAINRAARAANEREALARETPSAAPLSVDLSGLSSGTDFDQFATTMSSARKRATKWMLAGGGSLAVLVIAIAAVAGGGNSDDAKKNDVKPATASASTSLPAAARIVPVNDALPNAPLVKSAAPAAEPALTPAATPVAAAPRAAVAPTPASKAHRPGATPKKAQRKGPKLIKVASTGVTP